MEGHNFAFPNTLGGAAQKTVDQLRYWALDSGQCQAGTEYMYYGRQGGGFPGSGAERKRSMHVMKRVYELI